MIAYDKEYYELKERADNHLTASKVIFTPELQCSVKLSAIFYELRRQNILLEKQNELIQCSSK
jgi:hypothetical protein